MMKHTRGRGKKAVFFLPPKTSYKLGTDKKEGEQVGFWTREPYLTVVDLFTRPNKRTVSAGGGILHQAQKENRISRRWNSSPGLTREAYLPAEELFTRPNKRTVSAGGETLHQAPTRGDYPSAADQRTQKAVYLPATRFPSRCNKEVASERSKRQLQ